MTAATARANLRLPLLASISRYLFVTYAPTLALVAGRSGDIPGALYGLCRLEHLPRPQAATPIVAAPSGIGPGVRDSPCIRGVLSNAPIQYPQATMACAYVCSIRRRARSSDPLCLHNFDVRHTIADETYRGNLARTSARYPTADHHPRHRRERADRRMRPRRKEPNAVGRNGDIPRTRREVRIS